MKIQLTPALAKLVQRKMRTGYYVNESEVVCEAMRTMIERDDWHALESNKQKVGPDETTGKTDRRGLPDETRGAVRVRAAVRGARKARKKAR